MTSRSRSTQKKTGKGALPTVVCVIGMHRSGTSVCARAIQALGVHLGPPDHLMSEASDNQAGFWENARLTELNGKIIRTFGGTWIQPPALPDGWEHSSKIAELFEEARTIVKEEFGDEVFFGWKDPRNSLTLPFWKKLFPQMRCIVSLRNPLSVCESLRKRDGIPYEDSARLWNRYVSSVLIHSADLPRLMVSYEDLMADPRGVLRKIHRFIRNEASSEPSALALRKFASFVEKRLQHHHHSIEELPGHLEVDLMTQSLYLILSSQSQEARGWTDAGRILEGYCRAIQKKEADDSSVRLEKKKFENEHQRLLKEKDRESEEHKNRAVAAAALRQDHERLSRSAWEQKAALEENLRLVERQKTESAALREELKVFSAALTATQRSLKEKEHSIKEKEHSIEKLFRQLGESCFTQLQAARDLVMSERMAFDLQGEVQRLQGEGQRNAALRDEVQQLKRQIEERSSQADTLERHLQAVMTTKSWRWTAGLRAAQRNYRVFKERFGIRAPLRFSSRDPQASIIIPVFGNVRYTKACLEAVRKNTRVPYEIIVVDDGSTDTTPSYLKTVRGIQMIRHPKNRGFIAACNAGAEAAKAPFLVFLNNDTKVAEGWLEELLGTFREVPEAGLVGAKLLYPDGRLQEAGGIVWKDGSAWNYGRNSDPRKPAFSYLREVDYCSAACMAVPRKLFADIGGFDARYAPAYCEDTDLAFTIRAAGKKTLYQPLARVIHHEGATAGTDTMQGIKHYQKINQVKFFEKWRAVLQEHRPNGELPELEKERAVSKRALVIDEAPITPDQDSGSMSVLYYMKILQKMRYKVTFMPLNLSYGGIYTEALQRIGIECLYRPYHSSVEACLQDASAPYDLVFISRPRPAAECMALVRQYFPQAHVVFNTIDLHYLRLERQAKVLGDARKHEKAARIKEMELEAASRADTVLVVSLEEKRILLEENPRLSVTQLYPPVEIPAHQPPYGKRKDILFVGGYNHEPNVDAVFYFVKDIFPWVHAALPEARFLIAGSNPTPEIRSLASPHIQVLGYVKDLASLWGSCRVSIAPIRYGAGVKMKIISSLSYGTPAVATSMAAEGMGLRDEKEILMADSPYNFARAVIRLYSDEALWSQLAKNGLGAVKRSYSLDGWQRSFESILAGEPVS